MIATCSKLDDVLSRLQGVKQSGSGYMALCPAHDDKRPSLSVSEKEGRVLINCLAGCKYKDVLSAIGLSKSDLFTDAPQAERRLIATYDYKDESGTLLFQKLRYEPKSFVIRVPVGNDWSYKLNGQRRVLYNLPELLKTDIVFVVEGEKDADTLKAQGLTATTNYDGASGKWLSEYTFAFKNKIVYVIGDNDEPGRKHAKEVYQNIKTVAAECRILQIPAPHKDATDFFRAGGTLQEFTGLCADAPEGIPAEWDRAEETKEPASPLTFTRLSSVTAKQVQWLWQNRIPQGMFSMLVGNPGIGKSFLTMFMVAQITTGRNWPDALNATEPGSVLLFSDEESLEYAIKPRLEAHGADCDKVYAFNSLELTSQTFTIQDSLKHLETYLDQLPDCRAIIFDPITAYLGDVNANANAEVRGVLLGLQQLAQRRKITVIGVSHFSKKSDIDAIYRTLGSTAFTAAARSVWAVVTEKTEAEDQKPARLLLPVKSNYSIDPDGLRFNIIDGQVVFDGQKVNTDVNKAIQGGHAAAQKNGAAEWLRERLGADTVLASEVLTEGEQAGFSQPTLQRAATELGVQKRRSALHGNKYVWSLK